MFNTGTVVGVFANIFGGEFPGKFIPSFSWGSPSKGFEEYKFDRALEVAKRAMERKGMELTKVDEDLLKYVHDMKQIKTQ